MSVEQTIENMCRLTNLPKEDILRRIEQKKKQLAGLVSEEGAALIVANELSINLSKPSQVKISQAEPGQKNITFKGRIVQKWGPRSFEKNKWKGRVGSLLLWDGAKKIKVVIWDHRVDQINDMKEGEALLVENAFIKTNKFGVKEAHLSSKSNISVIQDNSLPSIEKISQAPKVCPISSAKEGQNVKLSGTVTGFKKSENSAVLLFLEDESGGIVVSLPEQKIQILGEEIIGEEVTVGGIVRRKGEELELAASFIFKNNPLTEAQRLIREIKDGRKES